MKINEILKTLDNSWSREDVLLKIKNGVDSEYIVNEFLHNNQQNIDKLCTFIKQEDKEVLTQIENLSFIEANLIHKINNLSSCKNEFGVAQEKPKNSFVKKGFSSHKLGLFMMKWSNKFVFITLLTISAIALSKQAWT